MSKFYTYGSGWWLIYNPNIRGETMKIRDSEVRSDDGAGAEEEAPRRKDHLDDKEARRMAIDAFNGYKISFHDDEAGRREREIAKELIAFIRKLRFVYWMSEGEARQMAFDRYKMSLFGADIRVAEKIFNRIWKSKDARANFPLTQVGNAERFAHNFREDFRYVVETKEWLFWQDDQWRKDTDGREAKRKIVESLRSLKNLVDHLIRKGVDPKVVASVEQFWKSSENHRSISDILQMASNSREFEVFLEKVDSDAWKINTLDGPVDLKKRKLMKPDRRLLLTKRIPHRFDTKAECPNWEEFIDHLTGGEEERIKFLRDVVGYALTGDVTMKSFFVLLGPTNTGKTTFLEAIRHMMGDEYSRQAEFNTFLDTRNKSSISCDIAMLAGARFVSAAEATPDQKFDHGVMKRLTGGDRVPCRGMYKDPGSHKATYKIFMCTNFMPKIRFNDEALWNRLIVIPFDRVVPRADRRFLEKLKAEAPGIFQWALKGAYRCWRDGGFRIPDYVKEATLDKRDNTSDVDEFIFERCIRNPEARTLSGELFSAWKAWCIEKGKPVGTEKALAMNLKRLGFPETKIGGKRGRSGIALKAELRVA